MIRKLSFLYFNVTAFILITMAGLTLVDNFQAGNKSIVNTSRFNTAIVMSTFLFCFVNMFILCIVGLILLTKEGRGGQAFLYLFAALFFLFFVMSLSD